MPLLKLCSADGTEKIMAQASTLDEVLAQAEEKGLCKAANAKVYLQDWTRLDDDVFQEVLKELPMSERIFIVAEVIPRAEHNPSSVLQDDLVAVPEPSTQFTFSLQGLPKSVQVALESSQALPPRERRDLVRCVAYEMCQVSARPRRDFIRSVAEMIVERYPACLEDRGINGRVLGRGYDSLFQQLENRIENAGRSKQQGSGLMGVKKSRRHSYGCANWQPACSQPVETLAEKMKFLKEEGQKTLRDIDVPLALACMEATYSEQRKYINTDTPVHRVQEVKEEWPLLFHKPFFYKHAGHLLGKDVKGVFDKRLSECAPLLMKHLGTLTAPRKEIMQLMVETEFREKKGSERAKEEATIPLLAAFFKEDPDYLFRVLEEGASITDVKDELPSTPVVVALGGIFDSQCFVVCEQEVLLTEGTSFVEATCLAFLCYYVFNMTYAKPASTTLEFIQRELFDINPAKGRKSDGNTRTTVPSRIMKLAQSLRRA